MTHTNISATSSCGGNASFHRWFCFLNRRLLTTVETGAVFEDFIVSNIAHAALREVWIVFMTIGTGSRYDLPTDICIPNTDRSQYAIMLCSSLKRDI